MVAPPVGAWIETLLEMLFFFVIIVAPPVGAWIETYTTNNQGNNIRVAPPVGAWIETSIALSCPITFFCRTPRGCVD